MIWHARLEHGDQYMSVTIQADSKAEAEALAQRQNKRLADQHERPLYELVELKCLTKKRWWQAGTTGAQ